MNRRLVAKKLLVLRDAGRRDGLIAAYASAVRGPRKQAAAVFIDATQ